MIDPDGTDALLAGEDGGVTWGLAEFIGGRGVPPLPGLLVGAGRPQRSSPPGSTSPGCHRWHLHDPAAAGPAADRPSRTRTPAPPNAEVTLHLLDLDGGWVDVHWDRETYPYLVARPGPSRAAR